MLRIIAFFEKRRGSREGCTSPPPRVGIEEANKNITRPNPRVVHQDDSSSTQPIRDVEPVQKWCREPVPSVYKCEVVRTSLKPRQRVFGSVDNESHGPQRDARGCAVPTNPPNHSPIRHDARMLRPFERERNRAHARSCFNRSHPGVNVRLEEQKTGVVKSPAVGRCAVWTVKFRWGG